MSTGAKFTEFDRAYQEMLVAVWRDEAEMARLLADPRGYAVEKGLPIQEGAQVRVDRTQPEELLARTEIHEAFQGTPGVHVLRVPPAPPFNVAELSELELDQVAAGDNNVNLYKSD